MNEPQKPRRSSRNWLFLLTVSLFSFGIAITLFVAPTRLPSWTITAVDQSGQVGEYTSLALDAAGQPAISYYGEDADNDFGYLKFARLEDGHWATESVRVLGPAYADIRAYTSLVLDAKGQPIIASNNHAKGYLECFFLDGTTWTSRLVDMQHAGEFNSIALTPSGYPAVSYYHPGKDEVRYAFYNGTTWTISAVDRSRHEGSFSSLVIDHKGLPRISYAGASASTRSALKYAAYDGSKWSLTTIDDGKYIGLYTSLALDPSDAPRISYYADGALKYADLKNSGWKVTTIDGPDHNGYFTSLALNSRGLPAIAYTHQAPPADDDLKFAYFDGIAWFVSAVDSKGVVGRHCSLKLDAAGNPHISYYDLTNGDLKYATAQMPMLFAERLMLALAGGGATFGVFMLAHFIRRRQRTSTPSPA